MELSSALLMKLVSFLFWSGLYLFYATECPKQGPEWCSRVITLLHGSVATVVGLAQCGVWNISKCRLTMQVMPWHYALMVWSWGYFAFDLLWCLMYWRDNYVMLLHHVSALGAITIYMNKENTGCTFPCSLALMEITNPLLQTRWFLKNEGYDKTILFYIIEVTYLVLFLSLRGVLGTYILYKILKADFFDMQAKIMSVIFYIVSIALIYEVLGFVLYKYKTQISEFRGFLEEIDHSLNGHQ